MAMSKIPQRPHVNFWMPDARVVAIGVYKTRGEAARWQKEALQSCISSLSPRAQRSRDVLRAYILRARPDLRLLARFHAFRRVDP